MSHKIEWEEKYYGGPSPLDRVKGTLRYKTITPESFVRVWQMCKSIDGFQEACATAATPILQREVAYYQTICDKLEKRINAIKGNCLDAVALTRDDKKVLKGEKVWVREFSYYHDDRTFPYVYDQLKLLCSEDLVVDVLLYVQALEAEKGRKLLNVEFAQKQLLDPYKSELVPSYWSLVCRSGIFRSKGVRLQKLRREGETPEVPKWERLRNIASEYPATI